MNIIEQVFNSYRRQVIPADASEEQIVETKRGFYAGAMAVIAAMASAMEIPDSEGAGEFINDVENHVKDYAMRERVPADMLNIPTIHQMVAAIAQFVSLNNIGDHERVTVSMSPALHLTLCMDRDAIKYAHRSVHGDIITIFGCVVSIDSTLPIEAFKLSLVS